MADLIYLGFDREGLEEARRDQRRHAEKMALEFFGEPVTADEVSWVLGAIECKRPWPIR